MPGGRENRGVVLKMMLSRDKGRARGCFGRPVHAHLGQLGQESWEGHIPARKCLRVGKKILESAPEKCLTCLLTNACAKPNRTAVRKSYHICSFTFRRVLSSPALC